MHNSNEKVNLDIMQWASEVVAPVSMPAKKSPRNNRTFTLWTKLCAVRRVLINGEQKSKVGRDLGIPESTLRGWCKNQKKLEQQFKMSLKAKISMESTKNEAAEEMIVVPEINLSQLPTPDFVWARSPAQGSAHSPTYSPTQSSAQSSDPSSAPSSAPSSNPSSSPDQSSASSSSMAQSSSQPTAHSSAKTFAQTSAQSSDPSSAPSSNPSSSPDQSSAFSSSTAQSSSQPTANSLSKTFAQPSAQASFNYKTPSLTQYQSKALNLTVNKSPSKNSHPLSPSVPFFNHPVNIPHTSPARNDSLAQLRALINDPEMSQFLTMFESNICQELRMMYNLSRQTNLQAYDNFRRYTILFSKYLMQSHLHSGSQ